MKQYIKQTDKVIKVNLRQLVIFLAVYRLVAGIFYIRLVNRLLRLSLQEAGYSYLTMGNMRAFLLRPFTVICALAALGLAAVMVLLEAGAHLAVYKASVGLEKVDQLSILKGALARGAGQWRKKNWQLLPLALANYLMMNSFILLRILTRVRPFDFVMYEILRTPPAVAGLAFLAVVMILAGFPAMMVLFFCMEEQLPFRQGARRSRMLIKEQKRKAVALLMAVNLLLIGTLVIVYVAITIISAILVTIFVDSYAAVAVLSIVGTKMELALLFIGSLLAAVLDFGALTVVYVRFAGEEASWLSQEIGEGAVEHVKRNLFLGVTGALMGVSAFMIFDMAYNGPAFDWSGLGYTEITAHRGSSQMAPENTMAALERAMEEMADYSEIDVQVTSDGVVVLCHDLDLKRVAGVSRRLQDMTWEEAKELDVGSYFSKAYKGERIPTLEQALEACKGRMKLNIELKDMGKSSSLPEQVVQLVKEQDMEEQCVLTSVSLSYLKRVKEADPDIKTGQILSAVYGRCYEEEYADFISIRSSFVTRSLVEAAHEYGKAVHVWTVNRKAELERIQHLGVDNVITDYPAAARAILYQQEAAEGLLGYLRMMLR